MPEITPALRWLSVAQLYAHTTPLADGEVGIENDSAQLIPPQPQPYYRYRVGDGVRLYQALLSGQIALLADLTSWDAQRQMGLSGGSGGPPTGAAGGILDGTYPNPGMVDTGVTPRAYTNANITVDADGRIILASDGIPGGTPRDFTTNPGYETIDIGGGTLRYIPLLTTPI